MNEIPSQEMFLKQVLVALPARQARVATFGVWQRGSAPVVLTIRSRSCR